MEENSKKKLSELFEQSDPEIKKIIQGDELDKITTSLGELHKISIDNYVPLKNIIVLVLLGALHPEDIVSSLKESLQIDETSARSISSDLDKTIFEKVRTSYVDKEEKNDGIKNITVGEKTEKDALREQIVDKTKRESAITKSPIKNLPPTKKTIVQGSRNQLLEQLQILESIPKDEDVEARLKHIKDQIETIDGAKEEQRSLSQEASEIIAKVGETVMNPETKAATYSKAPTHYNVDPYREVAEE